MPYADPPKYEDEWEEGGADDVYIDRGNGSPAKAVKDRSEEDYDKLEGLKRALVDTVYGTDLGFRAGSEVRAEVSELVTQLEAANPTPAPVEEPGLNGTWLLLYTVSSELLPLLAAGTTPLLKVDKITQTIDTGSSTIVNSTTLSTPFNYLSFSATASFEVRTPARIQPNWCKRYSTITEFHSLPSKKLSSGVPHEFLHTLKNYPPYRIMGSSNGLILCCTTKLSFETQLFIFNPVTQSKFTIPTPDYVGENPDAEINIAFECKHKGLQDSDDDFLLFLFEPPIEWGSPNYEVKFYSREANAWISTDKSFFVGSRPMNFDDHFFHNKALHFLSDCFPSRARDLYYRPYIMAYNIENGESRMIRLPNEARKGSHDMTCRMGIYKWGKVRNLDLSICLVILRKGVFTVWYLNDYESNTWFKVLKIRVKKIGIAETEPIFITGFTVMNGNTLIFAAQRKIYSYGLASENYRTLEEIGQHGFEIDSDLCFTSYSNTFRSLRNDDSS